jgi:hypothetical protein
VGEQWSQSSTHSLERIRDFRGLQSPDTTHIDLGAGADEVQDDRYLISKQKSKVSVTIAQRPGRLNGQKTDHAS